MFLSFFDCFGLSLTSELRDFAEQGNWTEVARILMSVGLELDLSQNGTTGTFIEIPEICFYYDVMTQEAVKVFLNVEKARTEGDQNEVNKRVLDLKDVNYDLYSVWIFRNREVRGLEWIKKPLPCYYRNASLCVKSLKTVFPLFKCDTITLSEYNKVSLRISTQEMHEVVKKWVTVCDKV